MSNAQVEVHIIDAKNQILGKVAVRAAKLLIGKDKVNYAPNLNLGDKVVVVNTDKVTVTGNKQLNKVYRKHTGFPGGLKSQNLVQMSKKDSTKILRTAISGMLPKNKLRKTRLSNLKIYKGDKYEK